jgi:3-oxoacyl-[acyl-carrier protein] reductase
MARGLARAGCKVVVTAAREKTEVDEVASEFNDSRVLALTADVTQPDDCQRVVDATVAQFGRLDVLVNNAGRGMKYINDRFMTDPTPFWETNPTAWQMIIDTNVNGTFFMARAAVPRMLSQRWGRIINISANYATMQLPGF